MSTKDAKKRDEEVETYHDPFKPWRDRYYEIDRELRNTYTPPARKGDNVVIVGFATTRKDTKYDEPNTEYWGFNDPPYSGEILLYDRWFQLHTRGYLDEFYDPWRKHLNLWKKQRHLPLYMFDVQPEISQSCQFPVGEIESALPNGWYHAGSFDWLVSFAILMGFKRITILGIGFMWVGEPISSRACLEYWLGVAEGRGIETIVPDEGTDIRKIMQYVRSERQYGLDESRPVVDLVDVGKEDRKEWKRR